MIALGHLRFWGLQAMVRPAHSSEQAALAPNGLYGTLGHDNRLGAISVPKLRNNPAAGMAMRDTGLAEAARSVEHPGAMISLAEWDHTVRAAWSLVLARQLRLAELLAANGGKSDGIIADPVPPLADPRALVFHPMPTGRRLVFFNHREALQPYQLGANWREIQRTAAGLRLDAQAPSYFDIGSEHQDLTGVPAEIGLRLANLGREALGVRLSDFRFKDDTYGDLAKRTLLDTSLAQGASKSLTLKPGESLDLPLLQLADGGVGAYQVAAEVKGGRPSNLAIKEIARCPGVTYPQAEVRDPWRHPALQGKLPRLPIYLDGGNRVGLPGLFKTHQEFVGMPVVSEVKPVVPGTAMRISGFQFGVPCEDDFPGRDRGYGFHIDHVVRFTLPAGPPKAFRFNGYSGKVAPQLDQQPMVDPEGKRIVLDPSHPRELPFAFLASHPAGKPWLRIDGQGSSAVYELRVSFPNGSNTYLEIRPLY